MARPPIKSRQHTRRVSELWTDSELEIAISAYLYLCRLEFSGVPYSVRHITSFLLAAPLKNRNDASIRYRFRNISYVFNARGWRVLKGFSPARQVGSGVHARIEAILNTYPPSLLSPVRNGPDRRKAIVGATDEPALAFRRLEDALSELESQLPGVGHNRPPEPIDDVSLTSQDVRNARSEVSKLQQEADRPAPRKDVVNSSQSKLLEFGLRLAAWVGRRITKFTDAALVTLAPILVAKATDVLPLIIEAVRAASRLFGR